MRGRSLLCVLVIAALAVPTVAAYSFFPDAKSQVQRDWQALFTQVFWAALIVFVLVEGLILYAIIRFRKRKGGPQEGPHVHGNTKMEIAWTIAPTLVMAWLLVVSLQQLDIVDNGPTPQVEIEVVGSQFLWTFQYPDGSKPVIGELRVEEDVVVGLHVTSSDVFHAFNVPSLGVMIDAVPGHRNYFWFKADEPGEYFSQCRELCGVGHGEMHATIIVFAAGTQDRPYGEPNTSAAPTTSPTSPAAGNNTTAPPGESVAVRLFDFGIDPTDAELEPGATVSLAVHNDGPNIHNLYIGHFDPAAGEQQGAEWFTIDLTGGESTVLNITLPAEPGAWNWWCNIPGHKSQGMEGVLSTGGSLPASNVKPPLLPGFELPTLLAAAFVAAAIAVRRRQA